MMMMTYSTSTSTSPLLKILTGLSGWRFFYVSLSTPGAIRIVS